MKRIILLLLALIFVLSSCNKSEVKSGVCLDVNSLNTAFSLSLNNSEYKGDIKLIDGNKLVLSLNYPENIKGIIFEISEKNVSVKYDGIKIENVDIPINSVLKNFYNCINSLKIKTDFSLKSGIYEFTDENYIAKLDGNGKILSLESKNSVFIF